MGESKRRLLAELEELCETCCQPVCECIVIDGEPYPPELFEDEDQRGTRLS